MANVNMHPKTKSLLKRIWAVLQLRDLFGAALFGRPLRINEAQCDADQLSLDDFDYDSASYSGEWMPVEVHKNYFIQAVRLSELVRPIFRLCTQSLANPENQVSLETLRANLREWNDYLPDSLSWTAQNAHPNPFSRILSIFYNNALILTLLPTSKDSLANEREEGLSNINIARDCAEDILTTASYLTTQNELHSVPHEMFTGLFLAQVILQSNANPSSVHDSKLSSARSTTFQMIWHQVKDFWEPASWITHLFTALPKDKGETAGVPRLGNNEGHAQNEMTANGSLFDWTADPLFPDVQPYLGDLSIFDQGWPSQPVLSSLFET